MAWWALSSVLATAALLHPVPHACPHALAHARSTHSIPRATSARAMAAPDPEEDTPAESSLDLDTAEIRRKAAKVAAGLNSLRSGDALRDLSESVPSPRELMSNVEQAVQAAAGQSEAEVAAAKAACAARIVGKAQPLPDSFEDSVRQAVVACKEALDDGVTRLVVEFDTSAGDETFPLLTRTMQFVQPLLPALLASGALSRAADDDQDDAAAAPGPKIQMLFPDEGTAAFVKQKWELPPSFTITSMGRAQLLQGADALLLINPGATEVKAVQRLLKQASEVPAMPLFMFNPKLISMQSTGYGLVGRELRNQVAKNFDTVVCLKSLPGGALYRTYPGDFAVWREDSDAPGGYVAVYSGQARPSGDDIDELLEPPETLDGGSEGGSGSSGGNKLLAGFSRFVKGFQAL